MRRARKLYLAMGLALVAMLVAAGAVYAAYTFDPATGKGFVGKGDVQLIYGWNNQALQTNASLVDFRTSSTSTTTWTCSKPNPGQPDRDIVQDRATTTTTQGLATTVARDNSKGKNGPVTGFNLTGYDAPPSVTTDGPAVGSCPAIPSDFTYDGNAETTPGTTVLQVSINGTAWFTLTQPATV